MIIKRLNIKHGLLLVIGASGFILALALAWILVKPWDFGYAIWHDHGGIGAGIERYGPQNRFKKDFEQTSREERLRVFAAINDAIHRSGEGLAEITYRLPDGRSFQLLRQPEVIHLQDVANLIDRLKVIIVVALFVWLGAIAFYGQKLRTLPTLKALSLGLLVFIGGMFLVLLVIGPKTVFNQLHIWVFPDNHQWFFYYQDSLMSTMMLAPNLFGYIAALLVIVSVVIFVGLHGALLHWSKGFLIRQR